jgi:uncharacterized protein YdbL (DUF1318 family)
MGRVLYLNLLLLGLVTACVTVNVYFPAAAAEQAADRIIDAVTSQPAGRPAISPAEPRPEQAPLEESNAPNAPRKQPPMSQLHVGPSTMLVSAAAGLLQWLIPAAQAQGSANLDISTPEIRAITNSMQQRFGELQKYFASGVVGMTNDGMVDVRDQNGVPLAERATVKRLVAEDNRDRSQLYAEIAKANGHPEWETDVRRTFARRWVERGAQPGWYYQDSSGKWVQK